MDTRCIARLVRMRLFSAGHAQSRGGADWPPDARRARIAGHRAGATSGRPLIAALRPFVARPMHARAAAANLAGMNAGTSTRTRARAADRARATARARRALLAWALVAATLWWAFAGSAIAGNQQYEPMSAAVRSALAAAIADRGAPEPRFVSTREKVDWLATMSERLPRKWKPDHQQRVEFLKTVRYEAQRAGLDPHMVLGLIEVESYFRRYAVSSAGARGYMQVMPFWTNVIGDRDASRLFEMRTNLRYGCAILRHYIDIENGDLFRALGRYNGSLGRAEYPNAVLRAWKKWEYYGAPQRVVSSRADRPPG